MKIYNINASVIPFLIYLKNIHIYTSMYRNLQILGPGISVTRGYINAVFNTLVVTKHTPLTRIVTTIVKH